MTVFHTDLDNTLIYSYKHELGVPKRCAEIYQNREISFFTERTYELLKKVKDKVLLVPTTTRSVEQYQRIDFGLGALPYALVCNGGVLLADGRPDRSWYEESLRLADNCRGELDKAANWLENDPNRIFEIRDIEGLFLFTKSQAPRETLRGLKQAVNPAGADVFHNGTKVYVVPKKLDKGTAVKRFRERIRPGRVIAAGDSEFDLSMLAAADIGFAPAQMAKHSGLGGNTVTIGRDRIFSESILESIIHSERSMGKWH